MSLTEIEMEDALSTCKSNIWQYLGFPKKVFCIERSFASVSSQSRAKAPEITRSIRVFNRKRRDYSLLSTMLDFAN